MKVRMYSIYDKKTKIYQPPIFAHNAPDALRWFTGLFREDKTMMSRFPNDYEIFDVGEFDDNSGMFDADKPTFVCALETLDYRFKVKDNENGQ